MNCDVSEAHSPTFLSLHLHHNSFSIPSIALPTSQLILQSRAHSPTFLSLHLHHNSFSNPSVVLPMSQLILQPFRCFAYVTAHSPTLPLLRLRHSSFSSPSFASPKSEALHLRHVGCSVTNLSVTSPTSQFILHPFHRFTYVTAHFPTLPSLYLRHSSLSNPSFALRTSQLILQPFFRFSYVTGSSLTSRGEPPMIHNIIDYFFYSCYMRRYREFLVLRRVALMLARGSGKRLKLL